MNRLTTACALAACLSPAAVAAQTADASLLAPLSKNIIYAPGSEIDLGASGQQVALESGSYIATRLDQAVRLTAASGTVRLVSPGSADAPARTAPVNEPDALATRLDAPFPNPARGATAVSFSVASDAEVDIRVFDSSGREVFVAMTGVRPTGSYRADIDGSAFAAGVYLVRAAFRPLSGEAPVYQTSRFTVVR